MKTARNILIAFILNLMFSIFEFVGGALTGSVAVISDAIHDMGDAMSIGISLVLEKISGKKPDKKHTYGYYRYSVLGSAVQSFLLLGGSVLVIYNGVMRFITPQPIHYDGMIVIAVIGFTVNFIAAYFTAGEGSLNQKTINLHMLEDVLGWAIVLCGAVVMRFTNWWFVDPALCLGLAVFIGVNALKNLKAVVDIFLEKTPGTVDPEEIVHHLTELSGVESIHHLHIWSMDGYHHGATLHAVVTEDARAVKKAIKEELAEHDIFHTTVEIESPGEKCRDLCCHIPQTAVQHHHHHHH